MHMHMQAGLQDRVIQTYEGCMYMDFAQSLLEERGYGDYVRLPIEKLPLLWLVHSATPVWQWLVQLSLKNYLLHSFIRFSLQSLRRRITVSPRSFLVL